LPVNDELDTEMYLKLPLLSEKPVTFRRRLNNEGIWTEYFILTGNFHHAISAATSGMPGRHRPGIQFGWVDDFDEMGGVTLIMGWDRKVY
jgi:hypothetical protein